MSMTKRVPSVATKRFPWSDQIHTYFELDFDGDTIRPGDKIRFRNRRGVFSFRDWCHNAEKDVTWINCVDDKSHQFRAFYMEELKSVIRPKRSRARKSKVVYIAKSK